MKFEAVPRYLDVRFQGGPQRSTGRKVGIVRDYSWMNERRIISRSGTYAEFRIMISLQSVYRPRIVPSQVKLYVLQQTSMSGTEHKSIAVEPDDS